MSEVWDDIESFFKKVISNGWLDENRRLQEISLLRENLSYLIQQEFFGNDKWKRKFLLAEQKVANGEISAFLAADDLFAEYLNFEQK